ncbi:hypothetical protein, partial [Streptomyces stelliscabiei]|uniref:hypothetical protein n=1 Tax=Streptomyces stelliscabiei TaxID=146820 RepID=UPI002FF119C1
TACQPVAEPRGSGPSTSSAAAARSRPGCDRHDDDQQALGDEVGRYSAGRGAQPQQGTLLRSVTSIWAG